MRVRRGSCNELYLQVSGGLIRQQGKHTVVKGEMRGVRDGGEIMVPKSTVVNKTFFALMVRILQEL